jgi:hypothetical protein
MPHILLTGAGFSRNWGGWLADEAFEYLLGCQQVDDDIRALLWKHKGLGGFEAALSHLQSELDRRQDSASEQRLAKLESAISEMFADMNKAFLAIESFESHNSPEYQLWSCLFRFDAIFSLNQDVLMEQHYLTSSFVAASRGRWNGWQIPGMEPIPPEGVQPHEMNWVPMDASEFVLKEKCQPYFKLHGSSTWIDDRSGREMLIIGGDKPSAIERHTILRWNHEQFKTYLSKPDTRLMVIGYGFGDNHINDAIGEAANRKNLRLFIIDPLGVDVLTKIPRPLTIHLLGSPFEQLESSVVGASRRTLREIFGGDTVEHGKVMRFFN